MMRDKAQASEAEPDVRSRVIDSSLVSSAALALAIAGLALWSMPRAVQAGDAGEFATIMLRGGVAHPSGYPWMRILGLLSRVCEGLGIPPAIAAALPSSLAGVVAFVLIHRCALALCTEDEAPLPPAIAWASAGIVLLVASAPAVGLHVFDSEVWGPHLLFCALFLRTALRPPPPEQSPIRRSLGLGLLLGLAVSHHLTAVLLVPLAVGAAWPRNAKPGSGFPKLLVATGGAGLLGSTLGLAPLLTLPIGAGGAWRWGDVRSPAGFVHHVLRRDYGTFSLSLHEEEVAATETLGRSLTNLGEVFTASTASSAWIGAAIILGLATFLIVATVRRGPETETGSSSAGPGPSRGVLLGWLGALLACTVAFPAIQNIDPATPFGAWILERFDLLPALLWTPVVIWAAVRGGRSLAASETLAGSKASRSATLLAVGGLGLILVLLLAQLGAVLERGRPATERGVEVAALDLVNSPDPEGPSVPATADDSGSPPVRAIVFGTDDHRSFPALYVQSVLDAGQHTLYIDAQLLVHPWYRAHLRERLPSLPDVEKPLRLIGAIWSDPELDSVPIYLANVFSEPAQRLPRVPEGLLWRVVLPPDHPRFRPEDWQPEAIAQRHLAALDRCQARPEDFAGLEHPKSHPWSADLASAYVEPSRALIVQLAQLARSGQPELAETYVPAIAESVQDRVGVDLLD